MKFLEYNSLSQLASTLSHSSAECTVRTRIEAYSCKPIGKDKKLWKAMNEHYDEEIAYNALGPLHPDNLSPLDSPFGSLDSHQARRTFCLLIATLNVAFPDHDFSQVKPDHFKKDLNNGAPVLSALSTTLLSLRNQSAQPSSRSYSSFPIQMGEFFPSSTPSSSSPINYFSPNPPPAVVSQTHPALFKVLNDIVTLSECEVYSYVPDIYSDPHAGGDSDDSDSESDSDSQSDEYEDYEDDDDGDELNLSSSPSNRDAAPWETMFSFDADSDDEADERRKGRKSAAARNSQHSPVRPFLRRRRGGLLWSTHWFFFHKKEKKILFISAWARKTAPSWVGSEGDTFVGWEGATGAGARAFGIPLTA